MQANELIPKRFNPKIGGDFSISDEYRYLLVIMGLPLIDGVFLSIVLSGGLESLIDSFMVGSFVLGGGATVGIILSEFRESNRVSIRKTLIISSVLGIMAVLQASFASSLQPVISTERFTFGAVLALIVLAVRIVPIKKTDKIVSPTVVIFLFMIISINPGGLSSLGSLSFDLIQGFYAFVSVLVATSISVIAIVARPVLQDKISQSKLKYATSIGLLAVAFSIVGIVPSLTAPIAFSLTALSSHV